MPRRSDAAAVEYLIRQVEDLKDRIKIMESAPKLRHASLEASAIPVFDGDGRLKQVIGLQPDGSYGDRVVESGAQPAPSAPILEPTTGAISVTWDGHTDQDGPVPQAFGRTQALAAPGTPDSADFSQAAHLSSIYSAEGGTTVIRATPGPWTVWLVMVGPDGATASPPSAPSSTTVDHVVNEDDLRSRIEDLTGGRLEDAAYESLMSHLAEHVRVRAVNIEARTIGSEHLAVGALDGEVITGALLQSHRDPDVGTKISDEAIFAFDDDGRVSLWLDGKRNRVRGELVFESDHGGELHMRQFPAEDLFSNGRPGEMLPGLAFVDPSRGKGDAGLFVNEDGTLFLVGASSTRGRAQLIGEWSVSGLNVFGSRFTVDPSASVGGPASVIPLQGGWRSPQAYPAQQPRFVRLGNVVFLKGALLTPSGGGSDAVAGSVPAPPYVRRLATSHATSAGSPSPVTVQISASGALSVLDGGQLPVTNVNLDGLFYFLD